MKSGLFAWLVAAIVVALVGALAGRALKGGGDPPFPFDASAPPYSGADLPTARSRAGFTGFNETGGLDGLTVVAGRVTAVTSDSISLDTSAGLNVIRLSGDLKLRTLEPYQGAIVPGTTVVVLKNPGTDQAKSVLLILDP